MARDTQLKTEILITANAQNADQEIKNIKKAVKAFDAEIGKLSKELDALQKGGQGDSKRAKRIQSEIKTYQRLRNSLNSFERESVRGMERVEKAVGNLAGTSTRELRRARLAAQRFRDSLAANDPQFAKATSNLRKIQQQIDKNTGAVNKHGSAWKTTIKNMMAYVGVFGALNMVKSKLEEIVSLNLKFSDQMADVRKVSGLAMNDIKNLANELRNVDTRTDMNELMQIAYSGAKLGFGNGGTEQLLAFTQGANRVNVALKEDLGEDALTALSKIIENMGLLKKMDVGTAMDKVGSSMFKLASTSTATAGNIVEFSKRLTAMARVAGITTDQLLALGSASDSMYLAPEVSATAFTKLLSSMQTNHNLIEKTLSIPKGTINDLFSAGKAMDAIVLIFQKMHDKGNMNALAPVFKDLGSDGGARLMNVMTAMAKNVDMLKKHLDTSREAYEDGTAVLDEYNIQQNTANALMERASNAWKNMAMNPENVDMVHEFAKAWYEVSASLSRNQVVLMSFRILMTMFLGLLQSLMYLLPGIITGLGAAGLAYVLTSVCTAIKSATVATQGFALALGNVSKATKFTAIGAIVGVLVQVAYWFSAAKNEVVKMNGALEDYKKITDGANEKTEIVVRGAKELAEQIKKAKVNTAERNALIRSFNRQFGQYIDNLLTEKSTAEEVAKAYGQVCKMLRAKYKLEAQQEFYDKEVKPRVRWETSDLASYERVRKKAGVNYDDKYLKEFAEKSLKQGLLVGSAIDRFNSYVTKLKPGKLGSLGSNDKQTDKNGITWSYNSLKANAGNLRDYDSSWFPRARDNGSFENRAKVLVAAANYLRQYYSTNKQMVRGSRMTSGDKDVAEYINRTTPKEEPLGTLTNNAPDKDAIKAARKAQAEAAARARKHRKHLQDQLSASEKEVKAFVQAIDAYYTLQEKAVQELFMSGKITEQEMNRYTALMKSKHDLVAGNGRLAIVGDKNNFDELRKQMGAGYDQFDYSEESKTLLNTVLKANPAATGKLIRNLEGQLGTSPENSMMNSVRNNAANNLKQESDRRLGLFKASDAYLQSKQYVENVGRDLDDQLAQAGFTDVSLRSGSQEANGKGKIVRTKTEKNPKTGKEEVVILGTPEAGLREDFRKEGVSHYGIDTNDPKAMREWLNKLVSIDGKGALRKDALGTEYLDRANMKDWTAYFPSINDMLLNMGNDADAMIKQFFSYLMQYEDKFYEAQRQRKDYETKQLNTRWERSDRGKAYDSLEEDWQNAGKVESIYGRGESGAFLNTQEMARNNGFADNITNDPEVVLAELQMRKMQEKLEMARQTENDMQAIRDAEKAANDAELAYAEKINEQIKSRMDLLQQWVDPIEQFAESAGDAFVKMTESASEGQQALKDATQNMLKTFAKMTIDMIAQQLKMETQRALFHNRMRQGEKEYQEGMTKDNEKGHKSIFKQLGSFFKRKKKDTQKANKDEKKEQQTTEKEKTTITETSEKAQEKVKTEVSSKMLNIQKKTDAESTQAKTEQASADAATTGAETQGNIFAGIASGAAKIIGKLGWWGIPLIAVIQGLLMGLLNSALSKLFGGKGGSASTTNTKLVSGMLTYDSGNVEAFSGAIDKKTYPVVGNDGNVYAAKPTDSLVTGLLTEPVATTVGGVPSLIAERGPEMIIGRETTQALMMARPDIISEIVRFDRNHSGRTYRAYDGGNVADVVGMDGASPVSYPSPQAQAASADIVATLTAMMPALQAFTQQLKQPLQAKVGMYGKDGLYENMNKANRFMRGK